MTTCLHDNPLLCRPIMRIVSIIMRYSQMLKATSMTILLAAKNMNSDILHKTWYLIAVVLAVETLSTQRLWFMLLCCAHLFVQYHSTQHQHRGHALVCCLYLKKAHPKRITHNSHCRDADAQTPFELERILAHKYVKRRTLVKVQWKCSRFVSTDPTDMRLKAVFSQDILDEVVLHNMDTAIFISYVQWENTWIDVENIQTQEAIDIYWNA